MKNKRYLRIWARRFLALIFPLILFSGTVEARILTTSEAKSAAIRLLEMENARPNLRLTEGLFNLDSIESLFYRNRPVAYLVKLNPQGFMILSDITEVTPQVFISFSGDSNVIREIPFLNTIMERLYYDKIQLNYLFERTPRGSGDISREYPDWDQINRNEDAWSALLDDSNPSFDSSLSMPPSQAVEPMLSSRWNQGWPYNNYTPMIGGSHPWAGCTAIAMAQVMFYWKYPERGTGSHSYEWNGQVLSANFNHQYYWNWMLDSYSGGFSAGDMDIIATLVSDVGISINMNYGLSGSSAAINANRAFQNYFKYSEDSRKEYRYQYNSWGEWFNVFKQQMDIGLPVVLGTFKSGGGHAVVVDGYRTSPSNQIHVNMGWGGACDNYYSVENIYGYGSETSDSAEINIHPIWTRLTLESSVGGTTDPAPGVYYYGYGTKVAVNITALPNNNYDFINWTGYASGTQNPINIVVDHDVTVKANFKKTIYPPLNLTGTKVLNRSLASEEYINIIEFEPNPLNTNIIGYKIYLMDNAVRQEEVASLDSNTFKFLHRKVDKNKQYCYEIVAFNNEPREGHAATLIIQ